MWTYPEIYDVIVMGAGHAGCEAAHAAARMGLKTALLTMNLDTVGKMSCNPAIGGVGKGHMVREIDALGGLMGKVIDRTAIQKRMLNDTRGPAVWAPRAQADKAEYALEIKRRLEQVPHLHLIQGTIEELVVQGGRLTGVRTKEGIEYQTRALVLSSGTFMRGLLHIGEVNYSGGRAGDPPSVGLSADLERHGIKLGRLKTGTPPRVNSRSIDFSLTEVQPGDDTLRFSFDPPDGPGLPQVPCHITYTTEATKKVIRDNVHRSPMYSGKIKSVGPRYCPSIEDKIVRFADKERHQIFLEPEGLKTQEIYVNGVSSSLPHDVQWQFIRTIPALAHAEIMRPAYAIEYDYVLSGQITSSLASKQIEGLFLAGQINGTTGYEEAAAQGLIAGINAALYVQGKPPFILTRSEAYIGVMIDDLITHGIDEPYRMFTSRAEYRLLLRQDNADLRLRAYGWQLGLIEAERYQKLIAKKETIAQEIERLGKLYKQIEGKGVSLAQLLCRPENSYASLLERYPQDFRDLGEEIHLQVEFALKYAGYIGRQESEVERLQHTEKMAISPTFNYFEVTGLRNETRQKLSKQLPHNLGQASRIPGITPADISILMIALSRSTHAETCPSE